MARRPSEKCSTRARLKDSQETIGYQADLGDGYWGSLYDEPRRNKVLAAADQKAMHKALKPGAWNAYVLRAEGRRIRTWLKGVPGVDYIERDEITASILPGASSIARLARRSGTTSTGPAFWPTLATKPTVLLPP
jgi:hypothetical protein